MDWDKLRVFHAVAEAGSFTHAGESLNLSQSAVSRQISALEESLSVPLFHRHARGLILTEQGELLYRTAHDVFMKLEAARTKLTVAYFDKRLATVTTMRNWNTVVKLRDLLRCISFERSAYLTKSLRGISEYAEDICSDCVPRRYASHLREWMDTIKETASDLK